MMSGGIIIIKNQRDKNKLLLWYINGGFAIWYKKPEAHFWLRYSVLRNTYLYCGAVT